MTVRWRYYLKMIQQDHWFVPLAVVVLASFVTVLIHRTTQMVDQAPTIALAVLEGVLPLTTAVLGGLLVVQDPARELLYTAPWPLWRTLLERMALLVGAMTTGAVAILLLLPAFGIPWTGWSASPAALLVWLCPAVAWLGVTALLGALLRSATATIGLVAFLWFALFKIHDSITPLLAGRVLFPLLTVYLPDSPDWPLNRLALLVMGLVALGGALLLVRNSERYVSADH